MLIDKSSYALPLENYSSITTRKTRIVLGNTFNKDMRHVKGWLNRFGGFNKKTAAFTISQDGKIYQHFEPMFRSNYLCDLELDNFSIIILLENEGWLQADNDNKDFITWFGDIYNTTDNVNNKQWRNHYHWSPYSKAQFGSTVELIKMLCTNFNIPRWVPSHNTRLSSIDELNGIFYKSNLSGKYTDLSPAWNFTKFKEDIEIKQIQNG